VGRPERGHNGWKIIISGEPERIEALSQRLVHEMEESG
jgi:hypothetical protein